MLWSQLHAATKRQQEAEATIDVLSAKAAQVDAAKAAATEEKRHESKASSRVAKRPVAGGAVFDHRKSKSRAMQSDMGGEMVGLDKCLR